MWAIRPAGKKRTVETYILDESPSLYGQNLSVALLSRLREAGADRVDMVDFTQAFADLSPEAFVGYLQERYDVAALAAGFNYTFGKYGAGTADTLRALGEEHGFQVLIAEPVLVDGEPVSSTRIRALVSEGRMEAARALLGRPYTLCGPVVSARHIGHTLGYPTANVETGEQLLPPDGVYAAHALLDGAEHPAVTNVGKNPTVAGKKRTVETYGGEKADRGDLHPGREPVPLRPKPLRGPPLAASGGADLPLAGRPLRADRPGRGGGEKTF